MVDVFLRLSKLFTPWDKVDVIVLAHWPPDLRAKDEFVPGDVMLSDRFADNFLRSPARVEIGSVPLQKSDSISNSYLLNRSGALILPY